MAIHIIAENLNTGFIPSSSIVHELNFSNNTNIKEHNSASDLYEFSDSQFGHIFTYRKKFQQSQKTCLRNCQFMGTLESQ
ncbi:5208_t:CDS:2 [Funneliformis geosporum]|uniref:5208_t:CDS:1 n=1 Tax=Funneliformis geosporum TaxID=1117311 RepID=A0A9W4T154_9GLOM|nr:5208_t:CDS:2 [Funneliformis geosporum]